LIRDHLKLRSGDQIDFVVAQDGAVILRPAVAHVTEMKGILHRKGMKPVSVEEMNRTIRDRFSPSK
jgi:bifunctional DNA-binding transcriptional regulator/antitoxin component of YhaV-PrlF toxin-antitoxin module